MNDKTERRRFNAKRLLYSFGYFAIIAIFAFVSSGGFSNDPNWNAVIGKIITTWSMTAVLIYLSYNERTLAALDDLQSNIVVSIATLMGNVDKVNRLGLNFAFKEYSFLSYKKRRESFMIGKLGNVGLSDPFILNLTYAQLEGLLTVPIIVDGHAFDTLTKEQYEAVIKVKTGKYTYKEIPSEYFLTASNDVSTDAYSHYANISIYRKANKFKQIMLKMGMTSVFAVAFALLAVPDQDKILEMVVTMLSTTVNGIMGIITGVLWARKDAKDHADENTFKTKTIDEFFSDYNSGVFIPTEVTEIVKQKLAALANQEDTLEYLDDDDSDDGDLDDEVLDEDE